MSKDVKKRKPAAEVFDDFESCFLEWSRAGAGRVIYFAQPRAGQNTYVLSGTELQAVKALMFRFGSPVKKLDRKSCHEMVAALLIEKHEGADA